MTFSGNPVFASHACRLRATSEPCTGFVIVLIMFFSACKSLPARAGADDWIQRRDTQVQKPLLSSVGFGWPVVHSAVLALLLPEHVRFSRVKLHSRLMPPSALAQPPPPFAFPLALAAMPSSLLLTARIRSGLRRRGRSYIRCSPCVRRISTLPSCTMFSCSMRCRNCRLCSPF